MNYDYSPIIAWFLVNLAVAILLESLGHLRKMGKSTDFQMKVLKCCKKLLMRLLELRIKEWTLFFIQAMIPVRFLHVFAAQVEFKNAKGEKKISLCLKIHWIKLVYSLLILQGFPTSLGYIKKCLRVKRATFTKKLYSAPKNCFLSLFCKLQKMIMDFKATFLQFQTIY